MTAPTPLVFYAGREYLITVLDRAETPEPLRDGPMAWSQNDSRWAHLDYAPGWTFRQAGCLVCCVAMLASLAYPEDPPTPVKVAEGLTAVGAFGGGLLSRPARISQAFDRLRWDGYLHWRSIPARLDIISQEIAEYGATIVELVWNPQDQRPPQAGNQHFAVAVGVVGAVTPPDVVIIDPWDGQQKMLGASAYAKPVRWSAARAVHGVRLLRIV